MTPLSSLTIEQISHLLHLFDCKISYISLDNGIMRTPKRHVINLSSYFLFLEEVGFKKLK